MERTTSLRLHMYSDSKAKKRKGKIKKNPCLPRPLLTPASRKERHCTYSVNIQGPGSLVHRYRLLLYCYPRHLRCKLFHCYSLKVFHSLDYIIEFGCCSKDPTFHSHRLKGTEMQRWVGRGTT